MDRNDLEFELNLLDKDELVRLFIKVKDINTKLAARLELVEGQLDELTDFNTLIESINY